MPFPIDVTRCLAFTQINTPLRVSTIPFAILRAKLAARGLRDGDEIIVELVTDGHVVVAKSDGKRVLVERRYAVMIEVEPRLVSKILPTPTWRHAVRRPALAAGA
jgi:hypothetical protein